MHEDLYGLRLSATQEAAHAYNAGLRRLLLVQAGPGHDMRAAVRADPGFGLAHAGLALLGHEYGVAGVNVSRSLAAATVVERRGTERERSQVAAVAAHVRGEGAAITAHLRAHPRDALMLGVAVPTIAFAGVTDVREEAWALVESLAPAYGDDWWYAGMLAFVRQDQERWTEAAALAARASSLRRGPVRRRGGAADGRAPERGRSRRQLRPAEGHRGHAPGRPAGRGPAGAGAVIDRAQARPPAIAPGPAAAVSADRFPQSRPA